MKGPQECRVCHRMIRRGQECWVYLVHRPTVFVRMDGTVERSTTTRNEFEHLACGR